MGLTIPHFVCLAAGDSEEGFWVELLVIVLLAAGAGVYSVAKTRARWKTSPGLRQFYSQFVSAAKSAVSKSSVLTKFAASATKIEGVSQQAAKPATKGRPFFTEATKGKDLKSGMELLARDFLAGVVEDMDAVGRPDIEMRRMCFNELIRREELSALSSVALKVYILDEKGFYGKVIQCAAMKELADRTRPAEMSRGQTSESPRESEGEAAINVGREIDG